jgi:hypothetical protein
MARGDEKQAAQYHNCIRKPPFKYGLLGHAQNLLIGMPVLHVSIGIGSKMLKLVEKLAPDAEQFTSLLSSLNLTWHQYHGNTLIGPQVHRLLHGQLYRQVLAPLTYEARLRTDAQTGRLLMQEQLPNPRHAQLLELFQLLETAYHLYTLDRFLSEQEVAALCAACATFGAKFVQYFPDEPVTPKLHVLAVEIPRFARTHGTVGLLSEQAVEAFHARVNQLHRAYAGMGESPRKWELIFQAASRLHNPLIPPFEPPLRLCSLCQRPFRNNKAAHASCRAARALLTL